MLDHWPHWIVTTLLILALSKGAATVLATVPHAVGIGAQVAVGIEEEALPSTLTARLDAFVQAQMATVGIPGVAYAITGPTEYVTNLWSFRVGEPRASKLAAAVVACLG